MTSEPLLWDAFIYGLASPVGIWSIWLMVRAVKRGLYVGGIRGGSE